MGEFWTSFEKLGNDLKLQLSLTIFGTIMPSLIYYVLLFTDEFMEIDLIKLSIICICINFLFILLFTFTGMLHRIILFYYNRDIIMMHGNRLSNKNASQRNNIVISRKKTQDVAEKINIVDGLREELKSIINSNQDIDYDKIKDMENLIELNINEIKQQNNELNEMINNIEIYYEQTDKQIKHLDDYVKSITDVASQIATSSIYYSVFIIFLTISKMIKSRNIDLVLNLDIILK